VPTAKNTGMNQGINKFYRLYGNDEPIDNQILNKSYFTHETYVKAVKQVVKQNLADFIAISSGNRSSIAYFGFNL